MTTETYTAQDAQARAARQRDEREAKRRTDYKRLCQQLAEDKPLTGEEINTLADAFEHVVLDATRPQLRGVTMEQHAQHVEAFKNLARRRAQFEAAKARADELPTVEEINKTIRRVEATAAKEIKKLLAPKLAGEAQLADRIERDRLATAARNAIRNAEFELPFRL